MTRDKRALDGVGEDIKDHIERQTQDNIDAGMAPAEARRQAMLSFGNVALVKEDTRAIWVSRRLDETRQDVRYALRAMRRTRGATIVGILVMALGIGANTAVFSVVHAVLLNPLPYADPDRIVTLTYLSTGGNASGERSRQVSVPDFLDWQAQSASFDSMAYYTSRRTSVMAGSVAEYAVVTTVTEEFFRVFAGQPSVGRSFSREEAKEGGAGAAMISDRYARQQFGEPARGLGRTLRLGNRSVSIVGVMPPAFDFPVATDVWFTAVGSRAQLPRRGNNFRAIARLKADVSVEQAHTEMTGISERLGEQYPDTNKNMRAIVTPLQREMVGDVESMLYLLLGAVALVLLIACATMATLLLAKATARIPEIAVRAALGASRSRIVKQMLVEASVQAVAAGTIGVLIAIWGTRTLVAFSPPDVPRLDEVAVNGSVLLFTLALCALVSFLFGLPPALQAARADVNEPLRLSTGRISGGGRSRTREALVVAEIALAVVLVATAALLVRSLVALQQAPLGFQPANVLLMQATAPPNGSDWSVSRAFFEGVLGDISQLPGVVAAGAMMGPPGNVESDSGYWVDRMPKESALSAARPAAMNVIAPGTFAALGIPIRQGRDFSRRRPTRPSPGRDHQRGAGAGRVSRAGSDRSRNYCWIRFDGSDDDRRRGRRRAAVRASSRTAAGNLYAVPATLLQRRDAICGRENGDGSGPAWPIDPAEGPRAIARGLGASHDTERAPGRTRRDAKVSSLAVESLRRRCAVPRDGGCVWCDGVRGRAALEGNRRADGARCRRAQRLVADAQPRIEDHRHRAHRRRAWRHRIHAPRQRHAISSPAT